MIRSLAALPFLALSALSQQAPAPHPFFDPDVVHVVHLTFAQADWYAVLRQNFEGQADPAYAPADLDWNGVHLGSIGVRFKGNSSYLEYPGTKKSFKLDLNEFVSGQELEGLDKLNLNNVFHDPSFVRERIFYELAAEAGLAAPRTNFTALYVNDEYWGLYVGVEQVDEEFLVSRFGADEQGTLWKGDPFGTLAWQGPAPVEYQDDYELETNEGANDWSPLIELCDALAHAPAAELPSALAPVLDVDSALAYLAVCNLTATLDSYLGRPHNVYYYERTRDGRFAVIPWDANESFGARPLGLSVAELVQLDPSWTFPAPGLHPLAERLYARPDWRAIHRGHLSALMDGGARPDRLVARMNTLRDVARPYVLADARKMYSNAQFEAALYEDIDVGIVGIAPALATFVRARNAFLLGALGATTAPPTLRIDEVVTANSGLVVDEAGQAEPWVEVVNTGATSIDLAGVELRRQLADARRFVFPPLVLAPGARALVWCDGEPSQGPLHAPFALSNATELLHLVDAERVLDVARPPALAPGQSWARIPDATGPFVRVPRASPNATNGLAVAPQLYVNEILASNGTGAVDEIGQREDWVEIWNPNAFAVDLQGWHLTDDVWNPTKWTFPAATIAANGRRVVWCDEDPGDGPLHASFKLSASGEFVGLSASPAFGGAWVDRRSFTAQSTDVSTGRASDGAAEWQLFATPTPLAANAGGVHAAEVTPYGIGKLSSAVRLPALAWSGTPSLATNDLVLRVVDAIPGSAGLLYSGPSRAAVPFAGGTNWVGAPILRVDVLALDGSGRASRAVPIDAALVGDRACFQFWFRDLAHVDGTRSGLTAALEVRFGP